LCAVLALLTVVKPSRAIAITIIISITVSAVSEAIAVIPLVEMRIPGVAARLRFLDFDLVAESVIAMCVPQSPTNATYGFAHNFQSRTVQGILDGRLAVECHKPESSWAASVLVHHQSCVQDSAKLHEVFPEVRFGCLLTHTAYEDL
jgi:hypothetical protein